MKPICIAALVLLLAGLSCAQEFSAPLSPDAEDQWRFARGEWKLGDGTIEQSSTDGGSCAILKEAAFADMTLNVEFFVAPEGDGVRAAALVFKATGTMTYYWVHLDTRNRQVILVRSTPQNTWQELGRKACGLSDDTWHTATIRCTGPQIDIALDGQDVLGVTDATISAGRIGLGSSQGRVTFRNITVQGETVPMEQPLAEQEPPHRRISRGEAAGPYQAFPDACRLDNGDIFVVFYAGYGHVSMPNEEWPKGGRICYVQSADEGRTWSEPAILFDDDDDNRDPHIAQLEDGTMICSFFSLRPSKREGANWDLLGTQMVFSTDGGKTWETEARMVAESYACSAPVRQMPDGTLIQGVYAGSGGIEWGGVIRSTDNGKTWSKPIDIGREANLYLDAETDVILLQDGTLYAALRSSKVNMHTSTSPDLGLTWTPVQDIGFVGHAPHFTRLSTGEILMTHRVPATALHVSRDECKTWQGPYVLDTVGGAYPATVELVDGTILAIYYEEGGGSAIRALRFKLKEDGIEPLGWE